MTAKMIDGNQIAQPIRARITEEVAEFVQRYDIQPCLGVVLVGDNPASAQYVRMKRRACEQVGMRSVGKILPADCTQADVEDAVNELNQDPTVHGILVQLPLPSHIDEEAILRNVSLEKDVDGLHPLNIGLLAMKGREPLFTAATPTGVIEILQAVGVSLSGANVAVLGRSNIVGMPVALMALQLDATVTLCHSRTRDLPNVLRQADIVIAAIGRANFVQGDWLKQGAIVVDVGTNKVDDPTAPNGYRFVGDVDLESALPIASAITKVPGGVGPMTITMVIANTMKAAQQSVRKTS